ncbi:MAG: hypothetical protein WAT79_02005, partial [Saprospiraceae bacterium]
MTIDILSYLDNKDFENLELNKLTQRFLSQVDEVLILNLQDKTIINQWLVNRIKYLSSWHLAPEVKLLIDSQSEISLHAIYKLRVLSDQDQVRLYEWLILYYSLLVRYYGFNNSTYNGDILDLNDSNSFIIEDGTNYYNKTYLPKFIQVLMNPGTDMDIAYIDYINNIKNEIKFSTNPKFYITSKINELISYIDIHSIKRMLNNNKEKIYVDGHKIIDDHGTFASESHMYFETEQDNKFISFDHLANFERRDLFLEAYKYLQSLHNDLFSKKYVTNIDWLDNLKIDDIGLTDSKFMANNEEVHLSIYYLLLGWLYSKKLAKPSKIKKTSDIKHFNENISKVIISRYSNKNGSITTLNTYIKAKG